MSLSPENILYIEDVVKKCLRNKILKYKPKANHMPFHIRLLGKDRMALFSFIQSLNTTFGSSIFEPVAAALGKLTFASSEMHQVAGTIIYSKARTVIDDIVNELRKTSTPPNKILEIELIRKYCQKGEQIKVKPTLVDLKIVSHQGEIYLFDLKTVKPNLGNFKDFKRTLLEWVAVTLAQNKDANVNSLLAIPYNPFEPEPYSLLWQMKGMIDIENEIKVAEGFWDFLGGVGCYKILLDIFEKVGIELKQEIDEYFKRFTSKK